MAASFLNSQLVFSSSFADSKLESQNTLVIYDRILEKVSKEFRGWVRNFPARYGVVSGEDLKDIEAFPAHLTKLANLSADFPARKMTVLAIGGGSVGDFAGFFASIYKRGVRLIHVPSTWLAAIDSSHGGKTALNFAGAKNQIGTFYPASQVVLIRSLLASQPRARIEDAMGELGKIALIDGGAWTKKLESSKLRGEDLLWAFLKPAILSKLKVVEKDPREISGIRQILNLGHTVGHVIEADLGLSHGAAVGQGLYFALDYSEERGYLKSRDADRARRLLFEVMEIQPHPRLIRSRRFVELLAKDKKSAAAGEVTFIFLEKWGRTRRESVSVSSILNEAKRQGWAK